MRQRIHTRRPAAVKAVWSVDVGVVNRTSFVSCQGLGNHADHSGDWVGRAQEGEDPFTRQRTEKRARVKAQAGRQLANAKASAKTMGARAPAPAALPPTLQLAAALSEHGRGRPVKGRAMRDDVRP